MKKKAFYILVGISILMCRISLASNKLEFIISKSVYQTFPEINAALSAIAGDSFLPTQILLQNSKLDSNRIDTKVNEILDEGDNIAIIAHSSCFSRYKKNQDLFVWPSNPNSVKTHFILLRDRTLPQFLNKFDKNYKIAYLHGYYIDRFMAILRGCYFNPDQGSSPEPFPFVENTSIESIGSKYAILTKGFSDTLVCPIKLLDKCIQDSLGRVEPIQYYKKENPYDFKCWNESFEYIEDEPKYSLADIKTTDILPTLESMNLHWIIHNINSIQAITRNEKVQILCHKNNAKKIRRLLKYIKSRYDNLKYEYIENKDKEIQEKVNLLAKLIYFLSPINDKNAHLAFSEIFYRIAKEIHNNWEEGYGERGIANVIRKITQEDYLLSLEDQTYLKSAIDKYNQYLQIRPKDIIPDYIFIYANYNKALLISVLKEFYYHRGNCKNYSTAIEDCSKSFKNNQELDSIEQHIRVIFNDQRNQFLKHHKYFPEFEKRFSKLFSSKLMEN